MGEIEDLKKEIASIRKSATEKDRRIKRMEGFIEERTEETTKVSDLSDQIKEIKSVLNGIDGKNGMKKSLDRLLLLIDGDEKYCIVGIVQQIKVLSDEMNKLADQRKQIKYGIAGMLLFTGLGNFQSILTLIQSAFK